jgi:hypothetical protein
MELPVSGTIRHCAVPGRQKNRAVSGQSPTNLMDGFSNEENPSLAVSTNETMGIGFGIQKFHLVQRLK